jgi:NitT/TauT family transport system ATP-binding protein
VAADPAGAIEYRAVSMEYQSASGRPTTVFQSLDLKIAAGEFFCIVGPSGCGKTTLLNMLGGFVAPTVGQVLVGGVPVERPGSDRGCVFQEASLFPWLTVAKNIEFGLQNKGVPPEERRRTVDFHLEMIGLRDARDKYPFELSGGMQQRVGIARALVNKPSVLLMDEPFAALDAITRNMMQRELLAIWQNTGATILYITHNIEEAVFLGTRVAVMSAHPGEIRRIVSIEIPHPRARTDLAFNEYYRELESTLYAYIDPRMSMAE